MHFFLQNGFHQLWLFAIFVLLVHPVRADDAGDDFINNLLTDIAPILALFGERVTTQFLSHSFSIYDCIIFAACPIGIITATVSAIRVAAPPSWRSLIGRAMESRATTELELLSSTSPDVCELWSGSALVRVMGSPGILELLYFAELDNPDDAHCGLFALNEKIEDRPRSGAQWPQMEGTKRLRQSLFEGKSTGLTQRDDEARALSDRDRQASPSISMNLSTFFDGSLAKLRLMTVFGVLIQLCVVGYSAMITYYGPWKSHFTKAGGPVPTAAFPLMMVGTTMISAGMFICALIIEKCTEEIAWARKPEPDAGTNTDATTGQHAAQAAEFQLLWLQKHKVVNDQAFKSYAIVANGLRAKLLTSDALKDPRTDAVPRPLKVGSMAGVLVSLVGFVIQFSGLRLMNWSATLAQLIGMAIMTILRAYLRIGLVNESKALEADDDYELDWLASELVTSSDRFWDVRKKRTNGAGPQSPSFSWLLGRDEGWFENKPEEPGLSEEECERPGEEQDLSEEEQHSSEEEEHSSEEEQESSPEEQDEEAQGEEEHGEEEQQRVEQKHEEQEQRTQQDQHQKRQQQQAIRLWEVRQRLGFLSPWTSDYIEVSKAVSLAIESVMRILRANAEYSSVIDSFGWSLEGKWSDPEVFPFTLSLGNDKLRPWGSPGEIEAALSTWSYFLDRVPEDRKVVRSMEDSHESLRRDITRWAGHKETGLLLFDLVQEGGPSVSHMPLSDSTRPLGTLLAQRVFLWFMLDLAKVLPSRLSKAPTVTFLDDNNPTLETTRLEHPSLTAMVQRIQQSGLASTEEAWDLVIVPLSFHRKLPSPISTVEKMRDESKKLEQVGQWEQVFKIQEQVAEVLKEVDNKAKHETEAYYRAAAIVLDTYRRVSSILDVQTQQLRRTKNLTQLLQVERKMKEIVCEKMEASVVRALLDFYGLQMPQSPRFEIGRLEMKFKSLTKEFEAVNADGSFKDITEARRLLRKFETPLEFSDGMFLWRPRAFNWRVASRLFPDPLGLTLAHHAMIRGVNKLASALDLVAPDNDLVIPASDIAGWTSLHYASMSHEVQRTMTALWRYGGSVHARSRDGMTPLHCLARTGTRDEVTHLLDLGAAATVQDNSGYTPLHWAAWCGNLDAIEALLSRGADPGSRDNYGRTALHIATISWKEKAVAMLSYKTDMGAQDVDGNTALHYAAMLGNHALARRNYAKGSNQGDSTRPSGEKSDAVEDDALVTSLFYGQKQATREEDLSGFPSKARRGNHSRHLDHGGKDREHSESVSGTDTSVDTGVEENHNKALPFETRLLGSVNVDGNAPIHVAIEHGHQNVVERLLLPGEQWRKPAHGITSLRLAVIFGRPTVVESLVKAHNDESKTDDLEKEKDLFAMIKDFKGLNGVLEQKGRHFGKLHLVLLNGLDVGLASPLCSPLLSRAWHRIQGKPHSSTESLQDAYSGSFSAETFYREQGRVSEKYIEDLKEIENTLRGDKRWAKPVPEAEGHPRFVKPGSHKDPDKVWGLRQRFFKPREAVGKGHSQ